MRTLFLCFAPLLLAEVASAQSCAGDVCIETNTLRHRVDVFASNDRDDTVRVDLTFTLDNMRADEAEPVSVVVPPGGRVRAATLTARDRRARWNYRYRFRWQVEGTRRVEVGTDLLEVTATSREGQQHYAARNVSAGPLVLSYAFREPGQHVDPSLPQQHAGLEPGAAMALGAARPTLPPSVFTHRVLAGRLDARADTTHAYALPIAPGDTLHVLSRSEGTLLLALPRRTPVRAVRAGVIVEVDAGQQLKPILAVRTAPFHFVERDTLRALRTPARGFVTVVHDDGSVAYYEGLDADRFGVRVGERVEVGRVVGEAGQGHERVLGAGHGGDTRTLVTHRTPGSALPDAGPLAPADAPALFVLRVYVLGAETQAVPVEPLYFETAGGVAPLHVHHFYTPFAQ